MGSRVGWSERARAGSLMTRASPAGGQPPRMDTPARREARARRSPHASPPVGAPRLDRFRPSPAPPSSSSSFPPFPPPASPRLLSRLPPRSRLGSQRSGRHLARRVAPGAGDEVPGRNGGGEREGTVEEQRV